MDKNSVYYFRAKIQKTVPVSFLILKDGKAKEKNNFYSK
ncbi:DKNYY domain-containing protein [Sebaldella termitidis]|nr:DKNYY domain-containing protein [Sebaldella termitidis]